MRICVHLPKPLLDAVDRRARALGISRNRLIVQTLEQESLGHEQWSEGFFERLAAVTPGTAAAVDDMLAAIRAAGRSRPRRANLLDG